MNSSNIQGSVNEIKNFIQSLHLVFDTVRLVDPVNTKTASFSPEGQLVFSPASCYNVWNKSQRCENCTSLSACIRECKRTKYEFRGSDVFFVISKPAAVVDSTGASHSLVLEMVSQITDDTLLEAFGKGNIIENVTRTNRKIYNDSLTSVYNRRYFDEYIFLQHYSGGIPKQVAFILVDLTKFKSINDTMGHIMGDEVLIRTSDMLKKTIRKQDSVIRLGGDEFVITLLDCDPQFIQSKIEEIRKKLNTITYGPDNSHFVDASFGYSYTESFCPNSKMIRKMLDEADRHMYADKKRCAIDNN